MITTILFVTAYLAGAAMATRLQYVYLESHRHDLYDTYGESGVLFERGWVRGGKYHRMRSKPLAAIAGGMWPATVVYLAVWSTVKALVWLTDKTLFRETPHAKRLRLERARRAATREAERVVRDYGVPADIVTPEAVDDLKARNAARLQHLRDLGVTFDAARPPRFDDDVDTPAGWE